MFKKHDMTFVNKLKTAKLQWYKKNKRLHEVLL